jgi:choline dehydrogenase-like flavoprotein
MIIDSRTLSKNKTIKADVCIVGAGTAGLTLAHELAGQRFQVCILESGGFEPDRNTQSLCWGENLGLPYYPLDTARARYFGGSTNRWHVDIGSNCLGARMRPLDEIDFEQREGVTYSGWPFSKYHLEPFYERAQSVCRIRPYTYEVSDWEDPVKAPRLSFMNGHVKTVIFKFGSTKPFLADYKSEITRAENIDVYTFANVLNIKTNKTAQAVTSLSAGCLEGNRFQVSARIFILAAGGIETPRLLLLSDKTMNCGLGNRHDLVGRFFMEHLHLWSGILIPSDPDMIRSTALYNSIHRVNDVPVIGKLALNGHLLRQEKLLNGCIQLIPRIVLKGDIAALLDAGGMTKTPAVFRTLESAIPQKIRRSFNRILKNRITIYRIANMTEQMPNPDSRVMLGNEKDELGQKRAQLQWRITDGDIFSMLRMQGIVDKELRSSGLGSLIIQLKPEKPPDGLHGGYHHMGTTRMHTDPTKGVVDENCGVHDMTNLFIAGPSVFPTGGYANPVLTIVALTLRLADHIKKSLSQEI